MDKISVQVRHTFIFLELGSNGCGFFINQLEAFGKILFKANSVVEFDLEKSKLICKEHNISVHFSITEHISQFFSPPVPSLISTKSDIQASKPVLKNDLDMMPDELALSKIAGLHRKVRLAMRKTSGLSRDLLPLSNDEVMDFLRVLPITLVQEQSKNVCVLGIYSYLLASSHIKSSK
ncbi:MAG: hypothetical protein DSY85_13400, partial [Marinomonas sp.]